MYLHLPRIIPNKLKRSIEVFINESFRYTQRMVNKMNHTWGMGLGWVIGHIILIGIIWLIIYAVNRKEDPDLQ